MELFVNEEAKTNYIDNFKDPFKSDKIKSVFFHIRQCPFAEKTTFGANVKFENGMTEGKQNFEANDFVSLVVAVDHFIKNL